MNEGLSRHVKAFARSTRERGLPVTLRVACGTLWWTLLDHIDESVYRTNTKGDVPLASLEIQSPNKAHATPYASPSQHRIIRKTLKTLGKLSRSDLSKSTLVDLGCGRGRVLIVGSAFGFKKVIGVEFSPELCREAEANLQAYGARRRKCCAYQIVHDDVARFDIPLDADVIFFFAAFDAYILDQVAGNIVRSYRQSPRPIWTIYVKATHGAVLERHGFQPMARLTWCGSPTKIYAL